MAVKKRTGREQRRSSAAAAPHKPDLTAYYRYRLPPLRPGDFQFELALLRPRQPAFGLDRLVDLVSWDDEASVLTGSLTAHRSDPADPTTLPIARGHLVRCRVAWSGSTYELWTMRCQAPQVQVDTATVTVTLQDDMALLDTDRRDWIFRATKRRNFGYRCDEIARLVAAQLGLKVGSLARGSKRMTLVMRHQTGLAVLKQAYSNERKYSGRAFILRIRNGRLNIVKLERNPIIYALAQEIQTALITQKAGSAVPTTVLTGRAQLGKGHTAKKISYTAMDRRVVRALGYVHTSKNYGQVSSHTELRDAVKRDLATGLRMNDTIDITHQGIPFILRGDGVELGLPKEGYGGAQSFVYCTRGNHTVQAGVYTSDLTFNQTDPYLAQEQSDAKAAKARAAKRAKRKRSKLK